MEPEARYTFVGTAVLMLLALLVAAVLWLRSAGDELAGSEFVCPWRDSARYIGGIGRTKCHFGLRLSGYAGLGLSGARGGQRDFTRGDRE